MNRSALILLMAIAATLCVLPLVSGSEADADTGTATIGDKEYATVSEALAASVSGDVIYVVPDGEKQASISTDATVKKGVKLVLPYSDKKNPSGTEDGKSVDDTSARVAGNNYRYLAFTVEKGATLTVYGDLVVGGVLSRPFTFDYQGHTSADFARMRVSGTVSIESGGSLHCYGNIMGSGTLVLKDGAEAYEPMMVTDYVGGDLAYVSYQNGQSPFNRYAVENIQCKLTMTSGATVYGLINLYADSKYNKVTTPLVSRDAGLIKLSEGAVMTTSYTAGQRLDGEWTSNIDTDVGKKYIRITGGAAFGSIVMDVQGQHIDTASTVFSVPYNFDVTLVDGSYSIPTKVRFLPGSGLYVYNDARLTVDGTLIAYNGLYDKVFRDKYYPTTQILGDYKFSKIADLVVDGTMEVKGTFAGLVQSMAAGAVVSIDGKAKVSLSKQPYGTSGSFSGKSMDNLSRMDLRAFAMDAYGNEVAMLAGKTYTSTDATAHTLASYSCYSPVDGKLTVVELGQAVKGSWSTGAYGVTYSANGGTGSVPVDPMRYDAGEYATVMGQGSLAKEQNKFAGWSTSASGGAVYKAGQKIQVNSDITLYAVWEPSISVTGVSLDKAKASIEEGGTVTLKANVAPSDAAVKTVSWSSSSSKVATVSNGKVTGVSPGTATITVTTTDGGFKATCEVTVTKAVVPVTGVDISLSSIVLKESASRTLAAAVLPANATDRSVQWSSADPSVATVSNGKVTAVSVGQTVITVTTVDGGFTDTCSVKVESAAVSVTGVDLTLTEARMTPGGSMALAYEVLPANATNKAVAWSSSNPDVADVAGGMVTAKSLGTATITITTADGGLTDKCIVTVVSSTVNVTGVTLNKAQASIVEGGSDILVATIAPANATNRAVEWTTSDAAVATVDAFGNVTAVAPGTAKITVMTKDGGFVASCTVEVTKAAVPVTGVSLDVESKELVEGDSFDLHATVLPADADDASVVWTTSDKDVASVADGRVTAVSAGSAVIRVTTADGGFVDECAVTVTAKAIPAAGVTLDRQSAEIEAGGTVTLVATVSPADASEKGVSWITSNANVAMVKDGIVTGVSEGEATITVETADGGFTATCAVKVTAPVVHATGVQLDFHSLSLTIGDLSVLKETVSPHEVQDKEVRWSSSDSKIVTVSGGSVRAISAGTATVTVTTVDGGYTDSCTVTVAEPPAPSGDSTLLYVGIGVAAIIAVLAAALLIKRRGA